MTSRCSAAAHDYEPPIDAAAADARLDLLPTLRGRPRTLEPLPGGITNRNYAVSTGGAQLVARFSSASSALLSIDREAEYRNSCAAAEAGIGPQVLDYAPGAGVLAVDWISGRTLSETDLDDDATLTRVADGCHRLHAAPRFGNDFDMFDIQRSYLQIVQERGFRLPPDYLDYAPQVARIRAALATGAEPTVPCHNDLLAANIMDDGKRLWFIDYEYSGNNEACFELGNIWSEAQLGPDRLEWLVTAYYRRRSTAKIARARLLGLMSQYGWTLWASIQAAISELDFNFWDWGMAKYTRAVAEFRSRGFDQLLAEASAGPGSGSGSAT